MPDTSRPLDAFMARYFGEGGHRWRSWDGNVICWKCGCHAGSRDASTNCPHEEATR